MKRVLVLTPYPYGTVAGPRSSFELWEPVLADAGIELDYAVFETDRLHAILYQPARLEAKAFEMARSYLRYLPKVRRARDYDAVLVNREAALIGPALLERWVARTGTPMIYHLDDPLYIPYRSPTNGLLSHLKFFGKVATICRMSRLVIANSAHHVEFACNHNQNVWLIPSLVDGELFRPGPPKHANGTVYVGWTGSPSTIGNLQEIRTSLGRLARRSDVKLRLVGGSDFGLPTIPYEGRPWRSETEVEDIRSFDIGLLPVPDTPWNRRKFFLKLVQYMSLGIPAVATPLGSNPEVINDGVTGLLASTAAEWDAALDLLVDNPDLRAEMGQRAAAVAHSQYTLQANAAKIVAAFHTAFA
jgi:glycosyltransferase involved in cell wall biosynthesis